MYVQWEKSTYTTLKEDVNGFHCQCFFFFFKVFICVSYVIILTNSYWQSVNGNFNLRRRSIEEVQPAFEAR